MNYTHTTKKDYHMIAFKKDGVPRAVLLPLDTPENVLTAYFIKLKQAKTQAIPASELEAAVA